jgi:membrane protein YdbS with pleckstrin-like domain
MGYPRNLIQEHEQVALDLRPHWWFFSRNILTGIPLFIIAVLALRVDGDSWASTPAQVIVGVMLVAWAGWLVLEYFQWTMTYFVVTSRRVIYRTGVIAKRGVEIPLERINNINFTQRVFERILGAGSLDIESAGKEGQSHFDFIRHPDGVQHVIYDQMDARYRVTEGGAPPVAATVPAAAAAGTAPPVSVPDQIEQLARLRDQGLLTDAEFDQKKAELLGRM